MIPSEVSKNIFHVDIPGGGAHVVNIFLAATVIIIAYSIQKTHPRIIRLINALLVCLLGHYIYEDIFIFVMGTVGRSIDALGLYVAITIGIVAMIVIVDKQYPSFGPDGHMFSLIFVLLGVFSIMYYTGWFHKLQLWYSGDGSDPHNLLWAVSKVLGFAVPTPLLREENNDIS